MLEIIAHFDGTNLCPDEPIALPTGVPLRLTIDLLPIPCSSGKSPEDIFAELQKEVGLVEGPADWSVQHDHYLFGAEKKPDGHAQ